MTTFTDEQLRQELDTVLGFARTQGEVRVKTHDGREYSVRPVAASRSALDVPGVDMGLSTAEIVACVRETRER